MGQKEFKFESVNFPADLEVIVDFSCYDSDGADSCIDEIAIFRDGNVEVKPEELAEGEMMRLEKYAQDIADEHGYEDAQDRAISRAEAAYDAWKEGD